MLQMLAEMLKVPESENIMYSQIDTANTFFDESSSYKFLKRDFPNLHLPKKPQNICFDF